MRRLSVVEIEQVSGGVSVISDIGSVALGPGVRGLRIPGYGERGDLLYKKPGAISRDVVVEFSQTNQMS
jgi:hypothetical protein